MRRALLLLVAAAAAFVLLVVVFELETRASVESRIRPNRGNVRFTVNNISSNSTASSVDDSIEEEASFLALFKRRSQLRPDPTHSSVDWNVSCRSCSQFLHQVKASQLPDTSTSHYHCVRMAAVPHPTVCLHPPEQDVYISRQLINNASWEPIIVAQFQQVLRADPHLGVIDLGANIGVYSLLAAKMQRDVIAVEPFAGNVARMLTAALIDNTTRRLTVLQNAVSSRCGIATMQFTEGNMGDIRVNSNYESARHHKQEATTKSLTLSCLRNFISFTRAVLKVDIQGSEHRALLTLPELLQTVDIRVIFMEWSLLRTYYGSDVTQSENKTLVNDLVVALQDRFGYAPRSSVTGKRLKIAHWYGWPDDVIWWRE